MAIGKKRRGLLRDRSTGSVWSSSLCWVLMSQSGGGEDLILRSVGSGQSSNGSCFCRSTKIEENCEEN